jgi:hypothetical protein
MTAFDESDDRMRSNFFVSEDEQIGLPVLFTLGKKAVK